LEVVTLWHFPSICVSTACPQEAIGCTTKNSLLAGRPGYVKIFFPRWRRYIPDLVYVEKHKMAYILELSEQQAVKVAISIVIDMIVLNILENAH